VPRLHSALAKGATKNPNAKPEVLVRLHRQTTTGEKMKAIYKSDGTEQVVLRFGDSRHAVVTAGEGYHDQGSVHCSIENTGNGYIAYFPATTSTTQDYYVCLDYAQAHDLVLALSMFKKELGFKDE
jgi:hypothetical protein